MSKDDDIRDAFGIFLRAVGKPGEPVKDREALLAALDVLDPVLAEELSAKWAQEEAP